MQNMYLEKSNMADTYTMHYGKIIRSIHCEDFEDDYSMGALLEI